MKINDKQLTLIIFGIILLENIIILVIGWIAGFAIGTYNQEQVMLYEIYVRDMNLTNRMCIVNNGSKILGFCPEKCGVQNNTMDIKINDLSKYDLGG